MGAHLQNFVTSADHGWALKNQHQDNERYDYPSRYKRDVAGKPFTKTRLAALRSDAQMAHLEGDDARLQSGLAFDLSEHPRENFIRLRQTQPRACVRGQALSL